MADSRARDRAPLARRAGAHRELVLLRHRAERRQGRVSVPGNVRPPRERIRDGRRSGVGARPGCRCERPTARPSAAVSSSNPACFTTSRASATDDSSRSIASAASSFAFAFFDNAAGDARNVTLRDGRQVVSGSSVPWTWQIAEAFKIEKGLIGPVESVLHPVPYGMGSGWSTWEDAMSSRPRTPRSGRPSGLPHSADIDQSHGRPEGLHYFRFIVAAGRCSWPDRRCRPCRGTRRPAG